MRGSVLMFYGKRLFTERTKCRAREGYSEKNQEDDATHSTGDHSPFTLWECQLHSL